MKRLKNIEGKNEQQLEAFIDQRKNNYKFLLKYSKCFLQDQAKL